MKYCYLVLLFLCFIAGSNAQRIYSIIPVRLPYGSALNVTFGNGPSNTGPPLPASLTAFRFSGNICPSGGEYTVVNKNACANWVQPAMCNFNQLLVNPAYWDINLFSNRTDSSGYLMYVNNSGSTTPKNVFVDTVTNLCGGGTYQFVATIFDVLAGSGTSCPRPDFTFLAETISGRLLNSYRAKLVDYNFRFTLPQDESGCIVKIIAEPSSSPSPGSCPSEFAIDNIQLIPFGPQPTINVKGYTAQSWIAGTCFQADQPLVLNSVIDSVYENRFTSYIVSVPMFRTPGYQWQKSDDLGLSWSDLPGATNATFSGNFTTPDTFLMRLRVSERAVISNPKCSGVSNIIKVMVDGPPIHHKVESNSPVCSGQDLKLNAEGGASYIWTGPNGFYDNVPFPHIFFSQLKDSGTYYAEIFSFGGCHLKDSTHVIMKGTDVHAGPDTAVCKGRPVQLYVSKGLSYSWSPNDGLSGTRISNPVATPGETTAYIVEVTDKDGCSDTAHVTVTIRNKNELKAGFSANGYLCRPADSVYFVNTSRGDIKDWKWNFGNGTISLSQNPPVQQYRVPANIAAYYAKLTVKDTSGCMDSTFQVLQVVDNCYIAVPSAFTPNGDGLNDYLYPVNAYKPNDLLFRVYNRMGKMVFRSRSLLQKWDGTINGVPQETGVYVWMLEYTGASGKKIFLKGTTLLIR